MKLFFFMLAQLLVSSAASSSILNPPTGDKTLEYMSHITGDSIIAAMSTVLNIGCLIIAGALVSYTILSGLLSTAHEGKILGSYNSMWTPLRATLAIAMLLPISGGFSTMQIAVIWTAERGVGLADHIWGSAVDYMSGSGRLYVPRADPKGSELAAAMLRNSGCLETIRRSLGADSIQHVTGTKASSTEFIYFHRYTGLDTGVFTDGKFTPWNPLNGFNSKAPVDACGTVELSLTRPAEDHIAAPIKHELMSKIATAFGILDEEMSQLAYNIINDEDFIPTGYELETAANIYNSSVRTALTNAVDKLQKARELDKSWIDDATSWGWLGAGQFYMSIQRMHAETIDFISITPTATEPLGKL